MKQKDLNKKINFNKTTVANLEEKDMINVRGGNKDDAYTDWSACFTAC